MLVWITVMFLALLLGCFGIGCQAYNTNAEATIDKPLFQLCCFSLGCVVAQLVLLIYMTRYF